MNTINVPLHRSCVFCVLLYALAAAVGCRRSDTVAISGKVALDRAALPTGTIVMIAKDKNRGPSVGCEIVEGRYNISADRGPRRGAAYRVEIRSIDPASGSTTDARSGTFPVFRDRVPAAYNSQSTLELIVPEDCTGLQKDFQLQSRNP
jgi:hypothetical protein